MGAKNSTNCCGKKVNVNDLKDKTKLKELRKGKKSNRKLLSNCSKDTSATTGYA